MRILYLDCGMGAAGDMWIKISLLKKLIILEFQMLR